MFLLTYLLLIIDIIEGFFVVLSTGAFNSASERAYLLKMC